MCADYKNPVVAADLVLLRYDAEVDDLLVCVGERANEPHAGELALPGVLMGYDESINEALERAARKVGISTIGVPHQLLVRDLVDRDSRFRVISLPHVAVTSEVGSGMWLSATDFMYATEELLPFDHDDIVCEAVGVAGNSVEQDPDMFAELMGAITIPNAKKLAEAAHSGASPASFKNVFARLYKRTGETVSVSRGRPTALYEPC